MQYIVIDENDKAVATVTYEGGRWRIRSDLQTFAVLDSKAIPLRVKFGGGPTGMDVDVEREVGPMDSQYPEALTDYVEQLGFTVTPEAN